MKPFTLVERKPTAREFLDLRESVGWPLLDPASLEAGLNGSCYGVCALMDDHIIGTGRIVGDGRTCFYLQGIIVRPEYHRTGIGTAMMKKIMTYIETNACHGAVVGLMSAEGKEAFYERFGSWTRPVKNFGCGMVQFWGENRQSGERAEGEQTGPPDAEKWHGKSQKAIDRPFSHASAQVTIALGKERGDGMNSDIRIAIVGDFEAERLSHKATNEALRHGADALGVVYGAEWVPTQTLETEAGRVRLEEFDAIFCSPGSPYRSMNGALEAIRFARERCWPFLGT